MRPEIGAKPDILWSDADEAKVNSEGTGPEKFRGLLYPPDYEAEVVLVFGMLLPHLDDDFVVEEYTGVFADCTARRNGKEVGIEFDVKSSVFKAHGHDEDPSLPTCDMIVC